jgi:tetratricopeptide (TPR) repeat protein
LAGAIIFLPTLWYGFVWDDRYAIVDNPSLGSWRYLARHLWGPIDPSTDMYRPVVGIVLFLESRLFGLHPWGYHLTSVLLHALACALVYRLALQLSQKTSVALFAGLLFAASAVHLEAVAWVSTVAEPLVASIILAGLCCYLQYRRQRGTRWLLAICGCLFLGLLTKETALVLPLLIAAFELNFGERSFRRLKGDLPLIAGLSGALLIYVILRRLAYTKVIQNESHLPFSTLVYTWPSLRLGYFRHLLLPVPLSPFYDSEYVAGANAAFWLPLLGLAAIAAAVYFGSRYLANGSLIRFCAMATAIAMIPVLDLNIFQFREILHDRFLYVPSVFFALLLAEALLAGNGAEAMEPAAGAKGTGRSLYGMLAACAVLLNIAALLIQSPVWKNDRSLFAYALRIAPNNPRPAFTLALDCLDRGDLSGAEALLQHVVRLVPAPRALLLLGQTRLRMGQAAAAEQPLRAAIAVAPERPGQHLALGECLQALGRGKEAIAEFNAEMTTGPEYREAARQKILQLQTNKP